MAKMNEFQQVVLRILDTSKYCKKPSRSNVHQFPDHSAYDPASNSEIVVPTIRNEELLGVTDLDSTKLGRFNEEDQRGLDLLIQVLFEIIFPRLIFQKYYVKIYKGGFVIQRRNIHVKDITRDHPRKDH
jgi:hypothetical protein